MNVALQVRPDDAVAAFAAELARDHVADVVERLNELEMDEASTILVQLSLDQAAAIFRQEELHRASELLAGFPAERAVALLERMPADRRTDLFEEMPDPPRADLLRALSPERRATVERLLQSPPNSAGSLMTTEFVSVPATWSVRQTLDYIRAVERTRETVYAIYVLDPKSQALVQAVSLRRLISGDPDAPILSVAPPRAPVTVDVADDREDVARLISKYDLLAVPVVDEADRVIGIVTVDDVIDAIVEEGTEDAQKFGGMEALNEPYMQIGFLTMIRKRAGWLSVLFLSEMLTASVMQHFEGALEKAVVLTLFIPLIMSSGGNSGSQATSLLIRALALREIKLRDWWRVALREVPSGVTLGAILGLIGVARIVLWQKLGIYDYGEHWVLVALTVGAALVGIVTFGSLTGSMLPFILQRLGFDPASASAPFVATLVDVTGLLIYFSVALLFLSGTLL